MREAVGDSGLCTVLYDVFQALIITPLFVDFMAGRVTWKTSVRNLLAVKQKYFKMNWNDDSKHNGAYLSAEEFCVVTSKPKQVTCTGTQLVLLSLDNMVLEKKKAPRKI